MFSSKCGEKKGVTKMKKTMLMAVFGITILLFSSCDEIFEIVYEIFGGTPPAKTQSNYQYTAQPQSASNAVNTVTAI